MSQRQNPNQYPNPNNGNQEESGRLGRMIHEVGTIILKYRVDSIEDKIEDIQRSELALSDNATRHVETRGFRSPPELDDPQIRELPKTVLERTASRWQDRSVRKSRAHLQERNRIKQVWGEKQETITPNRNLPPVKHHNDARDSSVTADRNRFLKNLESLDKQDTPTVFDRDTAVDNLPRSAKPSTRRGLKRAVRSDKKSESKSRKIIGNPRQEPAGVYHRGVDGDIPTMGGKLRKVRDRDTWLGRRRAKKLTKLERKHRRLSDRLSRRSR